MNAPLVPESLPQRIARVRKLQGQAADRAQRRAAGEIVEPEHPSQISISEASNRAAILEAELEISARSRDELLEDYDELLPFAARHWEYSDEERQWLSAIMRADEAALRSSVEAAMRDAYTYDWPVSPSLRRRCYAHATRNDVTKPVPIPSSVEAAERTAVEVIAASVQHQSTAGQSTATASLRSRVARLQKKRTPQ